MAKETAPFRIEKSILDNIKKIIPSTGQTIGGYINLNLDKIVKKDLERLNKKNINV